MQKILVKIIWPNYGPNLNLFFCEKTRIKCDGGLYFRKRKWFGDILSKSRGEGTEFFLSLVRAGLNLSSTGKREFKENWVNLKMRRRRWTGTRQDKGSNPLGVGLSWLALLLVQTVRSSLKEKQEEEHFEKQESVFFVLMLIFIQWEHFAWEHETRTTPQQQQQHLRYTSALITDVISRRLLMNSSRYVRNSTRMSSNVSIRLMVVATVGQPSLCSLLPYHLGLML